MARISDDLHAGGPTTGVEQKIVLPSDAGTVKVPSNEFISHADIARDGQDLVLRAADGHAAVVKGYFSAEPHPVIQSPSGAILTPDLVHSFVHHDGPAQYAATATANDASPVGAVREVHGHASVHHTDGTSESVIVGTAIHEGDVVETDGAGAVNITFRDNSSFAVSHNAKLAIDEYVFDPHSDAGASNFSMLRGVFVYTSGLIGHQDPDDVHIHTPAGSIGIRGTIIAGDVDSGQITVVEGAIVLQSNTGEETVLSTQYETAQFNAQTGTITSDGTLSAGDLGAHYSSLNDVAPSFFSGLEGAGATHDSTAPAPDNAAPSTPPADDNQGTQAAPDTLINTAATDTIGGDGGAFSTNDIFSTAAETTDSSGTGISDTASALIDPLAGSSASADTSSTGGSLSSVTTSPVVGQIFAGTAPAATIPPLNLDIATLATSGHGFWITDNVNEGFGSSIAVASNLSGGLDGILAVKNANSSVPSGLFYGIAGNTTDPGDSGLSAGISAHLISSGGDDNMVIASIGDFGPASTSAFIIGAPSDDSIGATSTGNISIVDSFGNPIETVMGLGTPGLGVGIAHFGAAVAGIGDINNDGYADVLIGSPGTAASDHGAAYVLFGSGTVAPILDMSVLLPANGFSIPGGAPNANLGTDVSSAGHFNNDGQADFMVSNPGTGIVDVYMHGSNLSAPLAINVGTGNADIPLLNLGDVNGGGVSDIGIVANNHLYVYYGGAHGSPLGTADANFSIAASAGTTITAGAVGDFNGDGKSDIGVVITNGTTADIYVVYGSNTLTGTLTAADLNNPNIAFHMVYNAATAADLSGMTIGGAGDMNGDGRGDLVIGLPGLDTNGGAVSADGAAVVVYGQDGGTAVYASGPAATAAGQSVVGDGTLSDGGFSNVSLSGGADNDTFVVNSQPQHVSGGNGIDELQISGTGTTLDFSAVGSGAESITGIEKIMMENGSQSLTLSLGNILGLMEQSGNGGNLEIIAANTSTGTTLTINTGGTATGSGTGLSQGLFGTALTSLGFSSAGTTTLAESDGGPSHTFNVYNLGNNEHLLVDQHLSAVHVV